MHTLLAVRSRYRAVRGLDQPVKFRLPLCVERTHHATRAELPGVVAVDDVNRHRRHLAENDLDATSSHLSLETSDLAGQRFQLSRALTQHYLVPALRLDDTREADGSFHHVEHPISNVRPLTQSRYHVPQVGAGHAYGLMKDRGREPEPVNQRITNQIVLHAAAIDDIMAGMTVTRITIYNDKTQMFIYRLCIMYILYYRSILSGGFEVLPDRVT